MQILKATTHSKYCEMDINNALLRRHEMLALVLCVVVGPISVGLETLLSR